MLYHFFYLLRGEGGIFNVFRYLTFRSMVAFFLTFTLVFIFQPKFIQRIRELQFGQPIREDGPQSHQAKKGTPTMGGVVMVLAILISTLLLADLRNLYVWVMVGITVCYGILGFLDDYKKVTKQNTKGVSARMKMLWQFIGACFFILLIVSFGPNYDTSVSIPFFKGVSVPLGWWYVPFGALVVVGASNAVNLTDGLDGLVTVPVMSVAFAYGVFAYVTGNAKIAEYLQLPYVAGCGDIAIFAAATIAGGMGFLWYNAFPAQVFMGDVGALALGGALGMMALITKQELLLVVAGGVFVVEAVSVILQVFSFKLTGKRIFRMAPIHHHFELKGMSEPKIIVRAWIISMILAIVTLTSLKLR